MPLFVVVVPAGDPGAAPPYGAPDGPAVPVEACRGGSVPGGMGRRGGVPDGKDDMAWNCPSCATVNADTAGTCVVCGGPHTVAAPAAAATPMVPVVTNQRAGTPTPAPPVRSAAPPSAVPGSLAPGAPGPAPGRSWNPVLLGALGLAVVAAIVFGVLAFSGGDGGDGAAPATTVSSGTDEEALAPDSTATVPEPITTTPPAVVETTMPATTTTRALSDARDNPPTTGWLMILDSLRKDSTPFEAAIARAQEFDARVEVFDSDTVGHANPGYWIVGVRGYASHDAAYDDCTSFGVKPGNDCNFLDVVTGARHRDGSR